MAHNYILEHEGKQYTPDGIVAVSDAAAHNKALEEQELATWASCPEHWSCYVTEKREVTTFLGTPLGVIVERSSYHHNFGSRMTAVTVRGTNGALYYGRFSSDWSQLCKLRKRRS